VEDDTEVVYMINDFNVWESWVTTSNTATSTAISSNFNVWESWVTTSNTVTSTAISSNFNIWNIWISQSNATTTSTVWYDERHQVKYREPYRETTEERTLRLQREAESRERQRIELEKREKEKKEALEKAEKLLREHLSVEQIKQLEKEGRFEVESESGKLYIINRGRAGNVYSLDERRHMVAKHCIHPEIDCPDPDTMLAQMLWLRWNERAFLQKANTTRMAA
jgi:hypothetical protein